VADNEEPKDPISDAKTIDALLETSGQMAIDSMKRHVALANNAMKRLVDPKSVEGSIADDAQQALGIVARDAMAAFTVWSRFLALAGENDEAPEE
jgi:hypothetical protein